MGAGGHGPRGRDVDHGVERRQQQLASVHVSVGFTGGGHRPGPDLALKRFGPDKLRFGRVPVRQLAIGRQPRVKVVTEQRAQSRLGTGRQQIHAQIRGADVIGFFGDELPL